MTFDHHLSYELRKEKDKYSSRQRTTFIIDLGKKQLSLFY